MSHTPCCCCCGRPFAPRPQNPTQTYCSQPACQRARKRASDPDYRANDQSAQRAWAQAHPQYWRAWREQHPEYVAENRRAQEARNARRRAAAGVIANEDTWTRESVLVAGTYRVEPWRASDCKCGRVNDKNLFVIRVIDVP